MWRIGALLALLFLLAFGFFTFLFWSLVTAAGLAGGPPAGVSLLRPLGILLLAFALLALIRALRGLRHVALPLGDLVQAAERVAGGDYTARVTERGPAELLRLTRTFNLMAERLESETEQRRNLLAEVTHELRTPLTVVQGNLEGLVDGIYPLDREHLEPIVEETRLLSRLVEDLATLALVESGSLKLQKEAIDPATLTAETAASFRAQAESAGIDLQVKVEPELPLAQADPARIRQVLVNILANALRYTPRGGSIRVRCSIEGDRDKHIVISVHDTGAGILPQDLPHIFERSYKSRDSHGSGLGLTIAKNLVNAHGGEITAESQPGKGTTVRFTLPV